MNKILKLARIPTWLIVLLTIVLLLRIPSFFEPYSYGDEMIYLTLGHAVREGLVLYRDIHDNKPPMLYLTAALAGSLFWFKVILAFWNFITIVLFWKLTQVLFPKSERLHKIATAIFAILTAIPLLEGNIANAEVFMIGFTIAGFLVLLSKGLTGKKIIFAGVLFSIATLFKVPAAFDVPAIVLLWFSAGKINKNHLKEVSTKTFYLTVGFTLPIAVSLIWFAISGTLKEYVSAAFLQNVGYLSSWRPGDIKEPFLVKNAPLLIRAIIVFIGFSILFIKRRVLSKSFIFTTTWLLLSLFAATLSERPYPHYLIQSVAPIAVLLGMLFTKKSMEQVLVILPLTLAFLVPVYYKFWYYQTGPYYLRFIRFTTGSISKEVYLATFGGNVINNYKIAEFIRSSTNREDRIFVWGDDAKIYALSRRLPPIKYVTDYHINDFSDKLTITKLLEENLPEMIVIMKDASSYPSLSRLIKDNYTLTQTFEGNEIWKLLSSGVRMLITP